MRILVAAPAGIECAAAAATFRVPASSQLLELKREGLEILTNPPVQARRRREWPILRRVFAIAPPEPDYAGKDKIEVLDGFLEGEIAHLTQHDPHFVDCALARLVRLISVRCKEGGLNMPPPIVSRIYQELSNGSIGFHQAQKIARVPFPFPYAQLLAIMRLYFILTVPLAVVCFTNDRCATSARARTRVARRARRAHGAAPPHPAHS